MLILIVEDNATARRNAEIGLSSAGHECVCVDAAEAALTLFRGGLSPDVLVADIVLQPGRMNGRELIETLLAEGRQAAEFVVASVAAAKEADGLVRIGVPPTRSSRSLSCRTH